MPNDLHAMVTRTTTQPRAQPAGPCAMAIFGAGGDLTRRLVIPALYNLMANRLLPDEFVLIGVDMAALSTEQWRQRLTEMMQGMLKGDGQLPNHLFLLLTMTAMEPPSSFDPDAVRNRKADTLKAIPPISLDCAVRGQYGKGEVLGRPVADYRQEPDVAANSSIETYVALKLAIDTWRWAGVPFYLRTGKSMSQRWTEIAVCFRRAPLSLFQDTDVTQMTPNWLVLRIQPDEGISLQFQVKRPGQIVTLAPIGTNFLYKDWFPPSLNVGYETLIYDCMIGDASLFQRADMVEEGWRIVRPVLDAWAAEAPTDFPNYRAGSTGPDAAAALLANDNGRSWRPIGNHVSGSPHATHLVAARRR